MNDKDEILRLEKIIRGLYFVIFFLVLSFIFLMVSLFLSKSATNSMCEVNNALISGFNSCSNLLEQAYNLPEGNITRLDYLEYCLK